MQEDCAHPLERFFGVIRRDPPEDPERVLLDHYYRPASLAAAFGVSVDALRNVLGGESKAVVVVAPVDGLVIL